MVFKAIHEQAGLFVGDSEKEVILDKEMAAGIDMCVKWGAPLAEDVNT